MTLKPQLDSLLIYDPNRSRATLNVWVAHPNSAEEERLGKLFMVCSIDTHSRINQEIISILQDELKAHYYQATDAALERAFESTLQAVNQRLHQLIADGINQWVGFSNIVVGAIRQQQLIMTSVRSMHGYMLRRSRLHDILGQPDASQPNPLRIFSHVVTGHLEAGDRLLVCTPSLLDYFSLEKLRRTMLDHQPHDAVRALESSLLGVDPSMSFGALVFAFEEAAERSVTPSTITATQPAPRLTPQVSMEELITRERKTEKLLAPSVWPALRDLAVQVWDGGQRFVRTYILRKPPKRIVQGVATRPGVTSSAGASFVNVLRAIGYGIRNGVSRSQRMAHELRQTSAEAMPKPESFGSRFRAPRLPKFRGTSVLLWWQQLHRRQQVLVAGILLGLLIFTGTIIRSNATPDSTVTDSPAEVANAIQSSIEKANAALLYGGEDTAREHLAEAEADLATLPNRTGTDRKKRDELQASIVAVQEKLAHRTVIDTPTLLLNAAATVSEIQPRQLYLAGTSLIVFDPDTRRTVAAERTGTSATSLDNTLDTGHPTTGAVRSATSIIFATDRKGLVELNTRTGTWRPIDARFPKTSIEVQSLSVFQGRTYALDRVNGEILRFSAGTSSIGAGANWLRETAALAEARSMIVDGSVFVLQSNGVVEEYFNGRKGTFALQSTSPALTDATRLWTDANAKHLYLLEPRERRVLVFDKTGKFIDQFTSPGWNDLRDIVADESRKTGFVINGTNVESFTLLH